MLSTGFKLADRYEISGPLGSGGMGIVYRARDLRLRRDVAVKILPENLAQDKEALSRFEREATAIAALSHPNILAIHDFGTDQEVCFAVMELLEGETLRQRLRRGPLLWQQAVEIGIWIADGLSVAHNKGIIHRDIKPENIFLTSEQQGKILDFGLARHENTGADVESSQVETETNFTRAGAVMGTVPYMSPEQVRGERVDSRSDLFSFGSMFYEMLTGKRPFDRSSPAEILSAILRDDPPGLVQSGAAAPESLEGVVRRCLQRKPEDRYQSARNVVTDLKAVQQGSQPPHGSPTVPVRRVHVRLWAAVLVLVIAVAGILGYMQPWRSRITAKPEAQSRITSLAVLPFVNEQGNPDTEYLSDGITESIMNKLSGLSDLKVLARDTVFSFKGKQVKPQDVGRELNVEAIVTGRVLLHESTLVIRVELVRSADGSRLWGDQYQRKPDDLLSVQDEISREISEKLQLKLTGEDQKRLAKRYTEDPEAHRLYLKGQYYRWKNTEEDYERFREYMQKAIDKDPGYALAYSGLGHYYLDTAVEGYAPPNECYAKAEAAHNQALQFDDTLVSAHLGLASLKRVRDRDFQKSEQELRWAERQDPRSPLVHWQFWYHFLTLGPLNEALQHIKQAKELDPLSRTFSVNMSQTLSLMGKYDEAIAELLKTIQMDPEYVAARFSLAQVYEAKGMHEEAISESQKAHTLLGDEDGADLFKNAKGSAGYREATKTIARGNLDYLNELAKEKYVSPMEFARLYAQLDEKDQAFQWLEKANEERSPQVLLIRVIADFNSLRSDPRFADLVRRIGLP